MKMESRSTVDPGDDTVVCRVVARYVVTAEEALKGDVLRSLASVMSPQQRVDGAWTLCVSVPRQGGARVQRHFVEIDVDGFRRAGRWSLVRLGPGVWDVEPSVVVPGQFHGYITLVDVPEPAPWS